MISLIFYVGSNDLKRDRMDLFLAGGRAKVSSEASFRVGNCFRIYAHTKGVFELQIRRQWRQFGEISLGRCDEDGIPIQFAFHNWINVVEVIYFDFSGKLSVENDCGILNASDFS